jgi:hypothetical protein
MVYLQTTYELCFGEAYFEYFESCDFSRENTNIDVSVFMFDLMMINMSSGQPPIERASSTCDLGVCSSAVWVEVWESSLIPSVLKLM